MAKGVVVGARLQADELAWLDDHARTNGIQNGRGAALADVLRQFMAGPEAGAVLATLPKGPKPSPTPARADLPKAAPKRTATTLKEGGRTWAPTQTPPPVGARVHVEVGGPVRPAPGSRLKKR